MNISTLYTIIGVVTALSGSGYAASQVLELKADRADLLVVASQTDFVQSKQIESTYEQIILLDAKKNKTPTELEKLRYLREELERQKAVRQQTIQR